jgi:hypothetical protein
MYQLSARYNGRTVEMTGRKRSRPTRAAQEEEGRGRRQPDPQERDVHQSPSSIAWPLVQSRQLLANQRLSPVQRQAALLAVSRHHGNRRAAALVAGLDAGAPGAATSALPLVQRSPVTLAAGGIVTIDMPPLYVKFDVPRRTPGRAFARAADIGIASAADLNPSRDGATVSLQPAIAIPEGYFDQPGKPRVRRELTLIGRRH